MPRQHIIANGYREAAAEALTRAREREARARGEELAVEAELARAREDRPPVKAQDWIENEYFSGSFAESMYPGLKRHFVDIVERGVPLVVMGGATRSGKTTLAMALQGRSTYEASCLASPQRTFGLQSESILLYLNMNVTDQQARNGYYTRFSTWVRSTPFFQREFAPLSHVKNELRFPKGVLAKYSGAQASAAESQDLFFFVGDEVNKYEVVEKSRRTQQGERYDAAEMVETAVIRRMQGTYMSRVDGSYPSACKVVWLCSETYPNSFIRKKHAELVRDELVGRGLAVYIESTEWGFKPLPKNVSYFYIRTASRTDEARALQVDLTDLESAGAPEDERFRLIRVPDVYRANADKNLEGFIRDMCGVPTEAISRFFQRREPIYEAIRRPGAEVPGVKAEIQPYMCVHPWTAMTTTTRDGAELLPRNVARQVETGNMVRNEATGGEEAEVVWEPIVNPAEPRYFGIDAGLTGDPCGLAIAHRCGWRRVVRFGDDNEPAEEVAPVVWVDMVLRIVPPPDGQIPFAGIRGVIYTLERYGFGFAKGTFDSFQRVALEQPFREHGLDVEVVSVDRTPDAYNALLLAHMEGRISVYEYPPLHGGLGADPPGGELAGLERVVPGTTSGGRPIEKIDHPPNGSKDVSDALAQAVHQVELASAGVSRAGEARRVEQVEKRRVSGIAEVHEREHKRQSAFERGDFEAMHEIARQEEDDYW
jgi:hypothetical protein